MVLCSYVSLVRGKTNASNGHSNSIRVHGCIGSGRNDWPSVHSIVGLLCEDPQEPALSLSGREVSTHMHTMRFQSPSIPHFLPQQHLFLSSSLGIPISIVLLRLQSLLAGHTTLAYEQSCNLAAQKQCHDKHRTLRGQLLTIGVGVLRTFVEQDLNPYPSVSGSTEDVRIAP